MESISDLDLYMEANQLSRILVTTDIVVKRRSQCF